MAHFSAETLAAVIHRRIHTGNSVRAIDGVTAAGDHLSESESESEEDVVDVSESEEEEDDGSGPPSAWLRLVA